MKKRAFIVLFTMFVLSLCVCAQTNDTMYIHKGQTVIKHAIKDVDSITFYLAEKEAPFLIVDETPIIVTAEGGTYYIAVNSNGEWTAVVENSESWITLTTNNDTIVVDVDENTLFESRSATVNITLENLIKSVVISQSIPCFCVMDVLKGEWGWYKMAGLSCEGDNSYTSIIRILSQNKDCSVNYEIFVADTLFYQGCFEFDHVHQWDVGYFIIYTNIKLPHNAFWVDDQLIYNPISWRIYLGDYLMRIPDKNIITFYHGLIGTGHCMYNYQRIK